MILVTGATGTTGFELVQLLVEKDVAFRALARSEEKAAPFQKVGVEVAIGDFDDPASLDAALQGVEKAYLCSPASPQQVEQQGNFVEAAKRADVQHLVKVSALGAADDSPFSLGRWHAVTERQIEESGMPFTILRPHSFMQNLLASMPTIVDEGVIYAPMGDGRIPMIDARDIAAVAAAVLTEPGHEGETYLLTGPEALSYKEVADKLSDAIGREVMYVDIPPDVARAGIISNGLPEWLADDLIGLYDMFSANEAAEVDPAVEQITGRPGRTIDEFARDYAGFFADREGAPGG